MSSDRSPCFTSDELEQFLQGRLSEPQAEHVAEHVDRCDQCQQLVAEIDERESAGQRSADHAHELPFADESQCGRLLDQVAGRGKAAGRFPRDEQCEVSPGRLGDYELQQRLGEGGMGTVYRAEHISLGTPAAVKILHPHRQADRATIDRFEREMVALGKLDHPHIVRALDAGEESGQHYLVMEYVDGIDLGRLVKARGELAVADAAEAIRQAALGLSYVHQHGRVHRDIKPSNLILSRDGMVKLLDLGLARVEEFPIDETSRAADDILGGSTVELTRTHQVMGTLEYMAPEQASDSHTVDHRADLYALGCTFYKLLTGRSPFASSRSISGLSQLLAHVETPASPVVQLRPDVPLGLSQLIDRMLRKNKDERPQSAEEIASALLPYTQTAELARLADQRLDGSSQVDPDAMAVTVVDSSPATTRIQGSESSVARRDRDLVRVLASLVGLTMIALLVLAAFWLPRWFRPQATLLVQTETDEALQELLDVDAKLVGEKGEFSLRAGRLEVPEGTYSIETSGDSTLTFSPSLLDLDRSRQVVLKVGVSPIRSANAGSTEEVGGAIANTKRDPQQPVVPGPIELIPLVDPQRDIRGDDWKLVDETLVSDPGRPSMMMLPYDPPDRYRLELTATRLQNNESLHLGLAAGDDPLIIAIDSHPADGSLSGLYFIDDVGILGRADRVHRGQLLPLGRPVPIVITVDSSANRVAVEMTVDGRRIVSWRGSKSQVNRTGSYTPPERGVFFLGNWTAAIRLSDLRVTPLGNEEGRIVRFADPERQPDLAAAQWVTWKGGLVSLADASADSERPPADSIGGFELLDQWDGHTGAVKTLDWSADGRLAASGSGWLAADQTLRIWDVEQGRQVHVIDTGMDVMDVAFSPSGEVILAAGKSSDLKIWNVRTAEWVATYPVGGVGKFEQVGWTPDGTRIIASAGREQVLVVLDAESGEEIRRFDTEFQTLAFDVDSTSQRIAIGMGDASVHIYKLESGDLLQRLKGPSSLKNPLVFALDLSADDTRVMAGYKEHTVRVWDLESGRPLIDFLSPVGGHECVLFTPDRRRAVVTGPAGITSLIDLETGRPLGSTPRLPGHGWAATMSTDGERLLTAGGLFYEGGFKPTDDYSIRLWKLGVSDNLPAAGEPSELATVTMDRHGDLPANPQIVAIDLQRSPWFQDQDTARMADLPQLVSLDLSSTAVTSAGLGRLGKLTQLERLSLAASGVSRWDTAWSESFPVIKELDLRNTALGEDLIGNLHTMTGLQKLDLSATPIRDDQLTHLRPLSNLRHLDLSFTAITEKGLATLSSMPMLEEIHLAGTSIKELTIFDSDRFPNLRRVNLIGASPDRDEVTSLRQMRADIEILSGFDELDLIQLIDLPTDSVTRTWKKEKGGLFVPGASRLALPIVLPSEFELTMTVKQMTDRDRNSPEIELPLPDGTRVMVGFDHWSDRGGYAIIHGIDGKMELDSPAKHAGQIVRAGAAEESTLRVRVEGGDETIRVSLHEGGNELVAWEGDRQRLKPRFYGNPPDPSRPTIGLNGSSNAVMIGRLTLRPLGGAVGLPDRGPSFADPDRGIAEWVLQRGGFVKVHVDARSPWILARCDSIEQLPSKPFRVAEISGLDNLDLPEAWWRKVGTMKELNQLTLIAARFDNHDLRWLTSLATLERVYAQRSQLNDEGLAFLAQSPRLETIAVGESEVTAEGLRCLVDHPTLDRLRVGIPDAAEVVFEVAATLPRLTNLEFYHSRLEGDWSASVPGPDALGPDALGPDALGLEALERLTFTHCEGLRAEDLKVLSKLPRLESLVVNDCGLTPESMVSIGGLASLRFLDIGGNEVGDEGFQHLAELRSLEELHAAQTGISDVGLKSLVTLSSLRKLSLSGVEGITDASFENLSAMSGLTELEIDATAISSSTAERLRKALPRCQIRHAVQPQDGGLVDLRGTKIDDQSLAELLQTRAPTTLKLEGLGITDQSIDSLLALPNLRQLALFNTRISESGIRRLRSSPYLQRIEFWNMPQITGSVTAHLVEMPNLNHVVFKDSGVYGPGLERFHETHLRGLNLGHSAFNREMLRKYVLPLEHLQVLDLAGTKIRDEDVSLLTDFKELRHLHLGYNDEIHGSGLVHLQQIPTLQMLLLDASSVDDDGLKYLSDVPQLKRLSLRNLPIGRESIELLSSMDQLDELFLDSTQLTLHDVQRMRQQMPGTEISAAGDLPIASGYPPEHAERLATNAWKASWSPDGGQLVYGRRQGEGLMVLDFETKTSRPLVTRGKDASWSPDGQWIAYTLQAAFNDGESDLWVVRPDGSDARQVAEKATYPFWISDPQRLVFYSSVRRELSAITVDRVDSPGVFYANCPSFYASAPSNGDYLAYGTGGRVRVVDRATREQLYSFALKGSTSGLPAMSLDGNWLAYNGFAAARRGIWVFDWKNEREWLLQAGEFSHPAWSPDGSRLVFGTALNSTHEYELWVMEFTELMEQLGE